MVAGIFPDRLDCLVGDKGVLAIEDLGNQRLRVTEFPSDLRLGNGQLARVTHGMWPLIASNARTSTPRAECQSSFRAMPRLFVTWLRQTPAFAVIPKIHFRR